MSRSSANVTDPFVESAALLSGPAALVVSRVLRSPHVVTVLANLSGWLHPYRSEITAAVQAVHRAAHAWESTPLAVEREDAIEAGAVDAESPWTTERAAALLQLSRRRTQELAAGGLLGGHRVGRQWILDEAAVREYQRNRRGV